MKKRKKKKKETWTATTQYNVDKRVKIDDGGKTHAHTKKEK